MIPLFSCQACGFLSTLGSEFIRIERIVFDKDCAEKFRLGIEPNAGWVADRLREARTEAAGAPVRRIEG